jgi:lipopolysaccharide biosynthesis glycosyltransferase
MLVSNTKLRKKIEEIKAKRNLQGLNKKVKNNKTVKLIHSKDKLLNSSIVKKDRKNLVITICIEDNKSANVNDFYKICGQYTIPLMKQYAESIKADFIIITESDCKYFTCNKYKIKNYLEKYDRVLYLDSDIIVKPNSPNIFDEVPEEMFGALDFGKSTEKNKFLMLKYLEEAQVFVDNKEFCQKLLNSYNGKGMINAGVLVVSKCHQNCFKKPKKEIAIKDGAALFKDQIWQNYLILKNEAPVYFLDEKWNFRYPYKNNMRLRKALTKGVFFVHFNGKDFRRMDSKLRIEEFVKRIGIK